MKTKIVLLTLVLVIAFFTGCARQPAEPEPQPDETPPETTPDVQTTASIVDDEAAFEKAISDNGTWIICLIKDLTFDKDLVLDGEFTNGKKDDDGQDIIQRKIALYTQDEKRNVTEKFTLTVPKLTINSPNARIQSGTFKGDLYVSEENFELVDTKVEGNVYFTNEEAEATFKMDEDSEITGERKLKEEGE
ncbi:MAG: hypothetical protein ACOX7R_13150 [Acetivibrionales bacterium]|jgi:hypothetical protein